MRDRRRAPARLSPYITPSHLKRLLKKPLKVHEEEHKEPPPVNLGVDDEIFDTVVPATGVAEIVLTEPVVPVETESVERESVANEGGVAEKVHDELLEKVLTEPVERVVTEGVERAKKFKRPARKRSDNQELPEDTLVAMVDSLVNENGFLTPPPPVIRQDREIDGPSTVEELYTSGGLVRCMFLRPGTTYVYLTKDFWGRLYGNVESGYLENFVSLRIRVF